MRDTIDMAREAGLCRQTYYLMSNPVQTRYSYEGSEEQLETFEALVRADAIANAVAAEREEFQRWFDAVTAQHKQEILAEREACARVCEDVGSTLDAFLFGATLAGYIRARRDLS